MDSYCKSAFKTFTETLTSYPILRLLDFSVPFVLCNDACDTSIGAMLTRWRADNSLRKKEKRANEQNFAVMQKEALAIVFSVTYFRHYLFGRKFTVITDHNP